MAEPTSSLTEKSRRQPTLPVVGIGASAGGIKALKEFFASVPPHTGIAWVVILHLSPDHDSKLAEVLQTTAPMPVTQVTGRVSIEPDHTYVISPNKTLEIENDTLILSEVTRIEQRRAPVDVFFRALADAHGSQSVAVVLSGTGPNGSAGLKRIKEHGGLALAQDPGEAEYGDMPRNSIATGLVDFVLPVAQMAPRIISYLDAIRGGAREQPPSAAPSEEDALREVLALLRARTGHDFSNYKPATIRRRVERRLYLQSLASISEYAGFIRQNPDESIALMKELLISVTNFFRDAATWKFLEEGIVPRLFANKHPSDQIRVWIPACATGEEAYSIAMLLAEHPALAAERPAIQLFGTDLDEDAIAVAREGFYTDGEVADVSEERLARFFERVAGGYHVRRDLRETVLFAHHNVIKDPPFSHLDLVSCRNLLIYLNRSIQQRVIETFHFALRPGGFLCLGTSESPESSRELFVRIDGAPQIYESRAVTSRITLPLADAPLPLPKLAQRAGAQIERASPADLHQRLLEQYAPPSVIVTDEYNLVHASDTAGRFLQVPPGEPSRDILRLVRAELRPDLRTALHQAARERTRVEVRSVPVEFDGVRRVVNIAVRPVLREDDPARGYFVVLFEENAAPSGETPKLLDSPAEPLARQLENELARVRQQLSITVERYEMQVDDAKASNEELQAMNEELRSAAEELETSKEELQSVNEELTTVNQELKIKIEELGLTNNDFQNFINSTDIGTIFLDRALRVKLFTPKAQDIFNLLPSDTGRPLSDITSKLVNDSIDGDVRSVLDTLQTIEREMQTDDGQWRLMRLLPYRTTDNRIDGIVATFQDITTRVTAENRVRAGEETQRTAVEAGVRARTTVLEGEKLIAAELLRRIVEAQEDERRRIARDLHDSLGQELTALRLALERSEREGGNKEVTHALGVVRTLGDQVDFLAWQLRPAVLDDLGLAAALPRFIDAWSSSVGLPGLFRLEGVIDPARFSPEAALTFYRVAQETLNNAAKHAHATRVEVVLKADADAVLMVIDDDGIGFDASNWARGNDGIGLASMRERAALIGATLEVESAPGRGTSVYLRSPLGEHTAGGQS